MLKSLVLFTFKKKNSRDKSICQIFEGFSKVESGGIFQFGRKGI